MVEVPYTIQRLGTDYFTEAYPVDEVALNVFSNPSDIIDVEYYNKEVGFNDKIINHIVDYDNFWFMDEERKDIFEHFRQDLLTLIEHKIYGAYTLLGSITEDYFDRMEYMRLAAENGVAAGMVSYGIYLYASDERQEGFQWVLAGAEIGNEIGQLIAGLSYEYGTFSHIDYDIALKWYKRALEEYQSYFAAMNIGAIYMRAGYYETALRFFERGNEIFAKDSSGFLDKKFAESMLGNADKCRKVIESSPSKRHLMFVLKKWHSNILNAFRTYYGKKPMPPSVFDADNEKLPHWEPSPDCEDIQEELAKMRQLKRNNRMPILGSKSLAVKKKIATFVSVEVRMKNELFTPNQHELIFFEKKIHGVLNQYLAENCMRIDHQMRKHGFFLTYLPAEMERGDSDDILGYALEEFKMNGNVARDLSFDKKSQKDLDKYWHEVLEVSLLPTDCAGFLHYNYNRSLVEKATVFDYIIIPSTPDIDYEFMFGEFVYYCDKIPLVNLRMSTMCDDDKQLSVPVELPRLDISDDFKISLVWLDGTSAEVKMPVLAKTLFIIFLYHTDGIILKELPDYKDELSALYLTMSNRDVSITSIDRLVDPMSNSANEQISRIRKAFKDVLKDNSVLADYYTPQGIAGEKYSIGLPRDKVVIGVG